LAFLPQFADPQQGPLPQQILVLGGIFIAATIMVFGSIALLAGMLGNWLKRSTVVQRILNRLTAMVFVGLAIRLAVSER